MNNQGVIVIGAGGLGCASLVRLASAGVSRIGIADFDRVETSNLPRQVLYSEEDLGRSKALAAADKLRRLPGGGALELTTYQLILKGDEDFLAEYSVVIDAVDRVDVKLRLHDSVVARRIPLVHAASSGWEGQLLTVAGGGCLRCLFGLDSAGAYDPPDCSRAGAVGPVVGLVGTIAAEEAIRIVTGDPPKWSNALWRIDARTGVERSVTITKDPRCDVCSGRGGGE